MPFHSSVSSVNMIGCRSDSDADVTDFQAFAIEKGGEEVKDRGARRWKTFGVLFVTFDPPFGILRDSNVRTFDMNASLGFFAES